MALFSQILALLAILALGFFSFKLDPIRVNLKQLTLSSLMVLLSVILSITSLMIPLFGFPALRIGISQLPLMLVGFLFGPSYALLAGLSADIIELLSGTIAFPFLGFTLNKILVAMLPALAHRFLEHKKMNPKYIAQGLMVFVFVSALLYVALVNQVRIADILIVPSIVDRVSVGLVLLLMMSAMLVALQRLHQSHKSYEFSVWLIGIMLVEIIVQLFLTPIWLNVMYGLPILISVSVRLIKAGFMIVIHGLLGVSILRVLRTYKLN
jgi:ECF transporter S component (folate family)